jgi:hypothetical protein
VAALSQSELDKVFSAGPVTPIVAPKAAPAPRFSKFAALYNKSFSSDTACVLTQDELDKVLARRK